MAGAPPRHIPFEQVSPVVHRFISSHAPPSFPGTANPRDPAVNKRVYHEKFGKGRILSAEGQGADKRYSIEFQDGEIRKVLGRFLTGLEDHDEPA